MRISYNWLQEYIDIDMPAEEVAEILTNIGLEVEYILSYGTAKEDIEGLVIGSVKEVKKHPNADKLKLTKVSVGNGKELSIICGAPNVAKGQKVVVAKVGATIHPCNGKGFKIKKAKIRGIDSEGMICAEDEIGLGDSHEGILTLPDNAPVGSALHNYLDMPKDTIFEVALTPNRADAMSHIGVAQDLYAYLLIYNKTKKKLLLPDLKNFKADNRNAKIDVIVENKEACPRYAGVCITNVKIQPSPQWLQNRLSAIGLRPLNNIVDITNYVLWEYGQPLHAFDADEITGNKVVVKTLPQGSKFVTLEDKEVTLDKTDLMICNEKEGMCIAGVFGGAKAGVTNKTKNIFLESAYFNSTYVRKTAQRHNLSTDAAMRFEKGADPNITIEALKRAALLIKEIAQGKIASDIIDVYAKPIKNKNIDLYYDYLDKLIGKNLKKEKTKTILQALGIEILSENKQGLKLGIPPRKVDVTRPADVVEDILRMYGYNNIPFSRNVNYDLPALNENKTIFNKNVVADYLSSNGYSEIVCNSFISQKYLNANDGLQLLNTANADLDTLRPDLLFSGLEVILYNQNRKNPDLKLFEFGKGYQKVKNKYIEKYKLAIFIIGRKFPESWNAKNDTADFFYVKAIVKNILERIGISDYKDQKSNHPYLNYGMQYQTLNSNPLVAFGLVKKDVLKKFDIQQNILYADFDWSSITNILNNKNNSLEKNKLTFKDIPVYPTVRRDLSLSIDQAVTYKEIEAIDFNTEKKLLKKVNLFDIYKDSKLDKGKKSYAVSLLFQDETKTLTDEEVDKIINKIINNFKKLLKAKLR